MKSFSLYLSFLVVFTSHISQAAERPKHQQSAICGDVDLRESPKIVWYVPNGGLSIHFSITEDGEKSKKYVVAGDLLIAGKESSKSIFACYLKRGKTIASGWIKKSELEKFEIQSFGSFEGEADSKKLELSYNALMSLSKRLPEPKIWSGTWINSISDEVTIKKLGTKLRLNTTGIKGAIGTGNEDEDSSDLKLKGSLAEVRANSKKIDICDIVILNFNNALLATSGSRCMGSGANHEYPEFSGVYWRQ